MQLILNFRRDNKKKSPSNIKDNNPNIFLIFWSTLLKKIMQIENNKMRRTKKCRQIKSRLFLRLQGKVTQQICENKRTASFKSKLFSLIKTIWLALTFKRHWDVLGDMCQTQGWWAKPSHPLHFIWTVRA